MTAPSLSWPSSPSGSLSAGVHRVLRDVVAVGGAVGWLDPPDRVEADRWLSAMLADVAAGDGALCVASVDGRIEAMGAWRRDRAPVLAHRAEVVKIMAHPAARGLGLGRLVTAAVVEDARAAGLELVHLGVRGNNHLAIALYEELGFREWGRMPGAIAVGDARFDDVRLALPLARPPGVVWHGSGPGGPGGSPGPDGRAGR